MEPGIFQELTFSQIPDRIFDYWLFHLTGAEFKVLCYIARRTYGFRRRCDAISLDQVCNGIVTQDGVRLDWGTGLSREGAIKAIARLSNGREGSIEGLGLVLTQQHYDQETKRYGITVYRLNMVASSDNEGTGTRKRKPEGVVNTVDQGVVNTVDQGSQHSGLGVVNTVDLQHTGLQHTVEQHTDISPIIPKPENQPLSEPTHETEPPADLLDWIGDVYREYAGAGRPPSPPGRKQKEALEAAVAENESKVRAALLGYWQEGGRSLDEFVKVNLRGLPKPSPRNSGVGRFGAAPFAGPRREPREVVRGHLEPANDPSAFLTPKMPAEISEWNRRIPAQECRIWTDKLNTAWKKNLAHPKFRECWPAVLDKCAALAAAGSPQSVEWIVKGGWVDIANGARDFLLDKDKPKKKFGEESFSDRCKRLSAQILSGEVKV